ncbi:SDR family NAD(P)-dependent oxidoreductase [Brachybacterium sp.]|uniref:SDR family NAD(P)-dependent oxidoreductase n=1 Tax=Brachybacterium sp. TaxID=1891286 RepID=UPI002ED283AC
MILVTGASGGVGTALCLALAREGEHLVLTARDEGRLEALAARVRTAGGTASTHPCDLRDQEAVSALAAQVLAQHGTPQAVVSLAGHSIRRDLTQTFGRPHDLVRLTGTNLLGPAALLLALLEPMCAAGRGRLIAVTSASARIPTPGWAAYGASKAGLDTWLRALRPQAAQHGVQITVVELPLVATAMAAPTYGRAPRGALTPEQAAWRVLRALRSRRTLHSPLWSRIGAVLSQAAPSIAAEAAGRAEHLLRRVTVREHPRAGRGHGDRPTPQPASRPASRYLRARPLGRGRRS